MQSLPPTPMVWVEQEQPASTLDHFPNRQTRPESQTSVANKLTPTPDEQLLSGSGFHFASHFPRTQLQVTCALPPHGQGLTSLPFMVVYLI